MKVPQTEDGGVSTQSGSKQEEESARGIKLNENEGGRWKKGGRGGGRRGGRGGGREEE